MSTLRGVQQAMTDRQKEIYNNIQLPQMPWNNSNLPLEKFYVDLKMRRFTTYIGDERYIEVYEAEVYHELKYRALLSELSIQLHELFDKTEEGKEPQRILVIGPIAIGKTTLCRKLLNDWSLGRDYLSSRFKLLFLFNLKDFQPDESMESFLARECQRTLGLEFTDQEILACLTKYQEEVLLILDGFDELKEECKVHLWPLLQREIFPCMSVLVTTRHETIQSIADTELLQLFTFDRDSGTAAHCFDRKVNIIGVERIQIKDYLMLFSPCGSVLQKEFILLEEAFFAQICGYPLFLHLLAVKFHEETLDNR